MRTKNAGSGGGDPDSIMVRDIIPPNSVMLIDNQYGSDGPVQFIPGSSGLNYSFSGTTDDTDDPEFYNTSGISILPSPLGNGTQPDLDSFRINPQGQLNGDSNFEICFRIVIE